MPIAAPAVQVLDMPVVAAGAAQVLGVHVRVGAENTAVDLPDSALQETTPLPLGTCPSAHASSQLLLRAAAVEAQVPRVMPVPRVGAEHVAAVHATVAPCHEAVDLPVSGWQVAVVTLPVPSM